MNHWIIGFFFGILTLHLFKELPSVGVTLILSGVLLLIIYTSQVQKFKIYILGYLFGFLWILWHANGVISHIIPNTIEGKTIQIVGTIASIPENDKNRVRFEFDVKKTIPSHLWMDPGKIRIRWVDPPHPLEVGDEWRLSVKLKRPHSYSNPGCFDFERYLFQHKIVAEGSVVHHLNAKRIASSKYSHPIDRLRSWLRNEINRNTKGSRFSGIINTLVVGLQGDVDPSQWQILRDTGTTHLFGLNAGFVASVTYLLVNFIWRFAPACFLIIPSSSASGMAALTVTLIYSFLGGFLIPTQRAMIMIAVGLWCLLSKRIISTSRSYFLALGMVLLFDPFASLALGFWFSFIAVGIILFGMKGRLKPNQFWWKWGRTQWIVTLGLTPVTLAIFGMTSLISPLANLIAIPWLSFLVVPFCLMAVLCLLISEKAGILFLNLANESLEVLWPILEFFSKIPLATWFQSNQTFYTLILSFISGFFFLLPKGFPGKYLGLIWLLPILWLNPTPLAINSARVTILDVGQGLATVVQTQNHVLIFDTGPKLSPNFDTGDRVILPFLASEGIKTIDALVISHGDNDHVGGAHSVIKALNVKNIITSEPNLFPHLKTQICHRDQSWEWDGVRFEMLHPNTLETRKRNDHSCVLRIVAGRDSFLITADIEAKSEKLLLEQQREKLPATVMLVPHHGSQTSSLKEFIQIVNPKFAIIPVGYRNRYKHPHSTIVKRYKKEGITLFNSAEHGAISFLLNGGNEMLIPRSYRIDHKRYWHFS